MSYPPGPPVNPPGGYQPGFSGGYGATPATNGKATAALITGLATTVLSWCCGLGLAGVVAIVLGVQARREIARSGGTQTGEGLATAGIVLGAVAVVLGLAVLVALVIAFASDSGSITFDSTLGAIRRAG